MPSARAFQQAMDIVKHWWLRSLQVNDQYALTDECARRDTAARPKHAGVQ